MEKRLIVVTAVLVFFAVVASFFINKVYFSPVEPEECHVLSYNGDANPNIVIFSDKGTAKKYMDYFFSVSPFNKHKNSFNFYFIDSYKPDCDIYKGVALMCYSRKLIKKAASCPNDYIAVIKDDGKIRSSSYMNVMSINSNLPLTVFPHEFGHAFANLADEYTPSNIPRGAENCVSDCSSFSSISDGCFKGCSKGNFYRSVDFGIMRSLSADSYGTFDENIISKRLRESSGVTGNAISVKRDCNDEKYILVEGIYRNGKMDILNKSVEAGCVGENGAGGFDYSILKEDGSLISGGEFNPELIFTDDLEGGESFVSDKSFLLKMPVIENAKTLEIGSEGKIIAELSLEDTGGRPCRV